MTACSDGRPPRGVRRDPVRDRLRYYQRVIEAYVLRRGSHLTFWHDVPQVNERAPTGELGEYYMPFAEKADYPGEQDARGVPLLNYRGHVRLQYNPIAIAQYGLGNYCLFKRGGDEERRRRFLLSAEWLVENLERNPAGVWVWNHHFDWEYRTPLRAPWYSALAQGQGVSLLVRAHRETGDGRYLDTAERAFAAFLRGMDDGGVTFRDESGYLWFEETIVRPPTHILNGFIWAAWGVYDYYLAVGGEAAELFAEAVRTLEAKLPRYDCGFWSLYEQSGTRLAMLASPFYHALHIVQLRVMHRITDRAVFVEYADRWDQYRHRWTGRARALAQKVLFKAMYY